MPLSKKVQSTPRFQRSVTEWRSPPTDPITSVCGGVWRWRTEPEWRSADGNPDILGTNQERCSPTDKEAHGCDRLAKEELKRHSVVAAGGEACVFRAGTVRSRRPERRQNVVGVSGYQTIELAGKPFRMCNGAIRHGGKVYGTAIVASLEDVEEIIHDFRNLLFLLIPGILGSQHLEGIG